MSKRTLYFYLFHVVLFFPRLRARAYGPTNFGRHHRHGDRCLRRRGSGGDGHHRRRPDQTDAHASNIPTPADTISSTCPSATTPLRSHRTGFQSLNIPSIQVQANRTATVDATLKVGQVGETITVEETPLLNSVDTTNGYVMDKAQLEAVPLPTGSFTGYVMLSPGVDEELSGRDRSECRPWATSPSGRMASATPAIPSC